MERRVIVYDAQDLQVQSIQPLRGQGGLAAVDDQTLIRSDGTHCHICMSQRLFVRKSICSPIQIPLQHACHQDGVIYANHYPTDDLYRIDQRTGKILDVLNLTSLRSGAWAQVTNGVAAAGPGVILVTGNIGTSYIAWMSAPVGLSRVTDAPQRNMKSRESASHSLIANRVAVDIHHATGTLQNLALVASAGANSPVAASR